MIIFFNMGFIFLVVLLLIFLVIGGFGIANAFLQAILDHWYIWLLIMFAKTLLDCFITNKLAKKTKIKIIKYKGKLKKIKNQTIICETVVNIIILCSMHLFLNLEMSIISDHMFLSVIYAIIYFAGIFSAFSTTFQSALDCFENSINIDYWGKDIHGDSPGCILHVIRIGVYLIFTISLIIPSTFWKIVLLVISASACYIMG